MVALALVTVIERPVGPLVPIALQRVELATTGAWGLRCFAAIQLLAFAVVAGIKEECENVTLEIFSVPPPQLRGYLLNDDTSDTTRPQSQYGSFALDDVRCDFLPGLW